MTKKIVIGYFADGPWAHHAFQKLINDDRIELAFICVRNDSVDETLVQYAAGHQLPLLKHPNINSSEFIEQVKQYRCDLFVSMSFNQIFRKEIINLPPLKTINCHAGKLPFYRGRNILNWALINDEREYGITVHYVDEGIDTGDIILQKTYPISEEDTYATLLLRAHTDCADILYEAIDLMISGRSERIKQSDIHPVGFYCAQRKAGDEMMNWQQTSRELFNFVRAICHPGPQARSFINGQEMKINRAEMIPDAPVYKGNAGQIVFKTKEYFIVKTADTTLKITEWTTEGKFRIGDKFSTHK